MYGDEWRKRKIMSEKKREKEKEREREKEREKGLCEKSIYDM